MLKKLFRECLLSRNCPRRLLLLGDYVPYDLQHGPPPPPPTKGPPPDTWLNIYVP